MQVQLKEVRYPEQTNYAIHIYTTCMYIQASVDVQEFGGARESGDEQPV